MRLARRAALSVLTLVSAAALAACGGTSSTSSSATDSAASDAMVSSTEASSATGSITVFAAASLQGAFEDIAAEFEKANPDASVAFDFQGSQDLVSALAEGASADVLATANTKTMKAAADQDLVGSQTEFATNALALIVPAGNPAKVTGVDDGSLDKADLVICAAEVPCGTATQTLAAELGVTLHPASEEQKVTDVRGKVESGEADAGIVYQTDAADAGDKVEAVALPENDVVNHYPIAVTSNASNAVTAQAFIDYVMSEAGQKILQQDYGFGTPAAK